MMRVVFDANVLLDAIITGREGGDIAKRILLKAARQEIEAIIAANTITDIYYVAKKAAGDAKAREAIVNLMNVFRVVPVGKEDCSNAIAIPMKDFEDALVAACARRECADCIVSRDRDFLASSASPVAVIAPDALLDLLDREFES